MLSHTLQDALRRRWTTPAVSVVRRSGPPTELTGAVLHDRARDVAARWRAALGPGPHALVLVFPAGEDFLVALLAGLLDGAMTVTAVPPPRRGSRTHHLGHIARDCAASAILCQPAARDQIAALLADEGGAGIPVLALGEEGASPVTPPPRRWPEGSALPAVIQYTSGSTRAPKGVRITAANILANCATVQRAWGLDADARVVNWLPHYHDMGLMGGILYPLLSGAWSAQMSPFEMVRDPAFWLRTISDHRATFSGGPAFAFAECLKRIPDDALTGLDLSCWQHAFCGAEPVPAGLIDAFRARFASCGLAAGAVYACYGMAEYTLYAAGVPEPAALPPPPPGLEATHPSIVPPFLADNVRVVDPDMAVPLPEGKTGEVWLCGHSVGDGYLGLARETRATFIEADLGEGPRRWLRTGDLGVLTGDRLFITGRIKDVIVVNGRKIAASEVEWLAARQHPALNPFGAAAFQPRDGEPGTAVLLIEIKGGHEFPDPHTLEMVRERIAKAILGEFGIHMVDVVFLTRGSLQRTTSGKVRRANVAASYSG
ncbi:AMP-binding protein [Novispirillum sp. DQ9]|uniref:AMP-binding protein n=1 Tax=Novispirillum sp. DQ9 TaxID=3398612 RepID=UPI003C7C156B